ncbi:tetratricopeptide repeat protein [Actinomadura graeca]|uniref:Tetratricopeptide repeat protein n=1 Tax=Actinomadura graeca TaxID=2750812 RepID=A0ABX8QUG6_9ACTN|nr:FxSxx-COOH system tetratricopeptide repeat protein [Actinomadura graeca]QXJ22461.1 tetratricopeptide repeat protein [Actinomadura graeca]
MSDRFGDPAARGTGRSGGPAGRPVWHEVSDVIWLAAQMSAAERAARREDDPAEPRAPRADHRRPAGGGSSGADRAKPSEADGPDEASRGFSADVGAATGAPSPVQPATPRAGDPPRLRPLRPPEQNGQAQPPSSSLSAWIAPFAEVRPLTDRRRLEQAFRPFKRTVASRRGEVELDDEPTATRAAQDGLWLPQTRPVPERWLDLDVVVDDGRLAALNRPTTDRFLDCLGAVGAFRIIRAHLLDTDGGETGALTLREPGPLATTHAAAGLTLRGRRDRRLVLVLTDGIGDAWHSGAAQRLLAHWGGQAPVVLINLLTRRQWRRTGLATRAANLFTPGPAVANRFYRVRYPAAPFGGDPDAAPEPANRSHVHVPVVELDAGQLAGWAGFATARRGDWYGAVAVCGDPHEPSRISDPAFVDDAMSAESPPPEIVRRFRAAVSPTVYALAVHLAAAPLNAPVMRLVQRTMLPESRASDLVELVGSGLLNRVAPERGPAADAGDEVVFDFAPGVRDELLAGGLRSDTTRVLTTVAGYLADRVTGLRDLSKLITVPERIDIPELTDELLPFVLPVLHVLKALGGPYRRPADALDAKLRGKTAHFSGKGPDGIARDAGMTGSMQSSLEIAALDEQLTGPEDIIKAPHLGVGVTVRDIPEKAGRKANEPPPVWGNVPPQNISFTGREELLEQLHERLSLGTTAVLPQALHGMGGVGKSQIAIEYVYRHMADYDVIWWIRSERPGQIQQDLAELAAELDLPVSQEVNVAVPAVREALRLGRPYRNWLLVFDNAEELQDVRDFFPTNGPGKILVTSRNQDWTKIAKSLEVDVFAREESKALLRLRGPDLADAKADELAEVLGDLPLAIAQAGVWLAETGMPVDEYLQLFREKHEKAAELLADAALVANELPVAAAWNVSLDRLRTSDPAALQLLQVCAFFAPEPISLQMLSGARNVEGPPELVEALGDPIKRGRAIRAINRYALARISHKDNTIMLHRLVQRVLVGQIPAGEDVELRRCGYQLMTNFDPRDPTVPANWRRYADLLPHVHYSGVVAFDDPWTRRLVLNEIDFLFQWGDHRGFLELAKTAVKIWTETLGEGNEQTQEALLHLGRALRLRGRFQEAYDNHVRVRDLRAEEHGMDDERTIEAQRFVSGDLRYMGQFKQALEHDKRSYEALRRMYGEDDPITLQQAHLYAISLRLNGDFRTARDIDRQTYRHLVVVFGENHGRALSSLAAIAVDEMELGHFDEARELTRQNAQRLESAFGSSYAGLAESLTAFSVMERKAGEHERALDLSTEALERYNEQFGSYHPGSISAALNHAVNLRQVGRLDDSIKLARVTARNFLKMFGPDHPNTPTANVNLAVALRLNGQIDEARKLDEAALDTLSKVLGLDHPRAIVCAINLASDHYTVGDFQEAMERDRRTLERAHRVLGEEHPTALACMFNLGLDLRGLEEVPEADELTERAIDSMRRVHGPKHPATTSAREGVRADCDIYPIPV